MCIKLILFGQLFIYATIIYNLYGMSLKIILHLVLFLFWDIIVDSDEFFYHIDINERVCNYIKSEYGCVEWYSC